MNSTEQFPGFNPVFSSTTVSYNEATTQASNIIQLPTQTRHSGALQIPATGPVNWWLPPTGCSGDEDVPMEDEDNSEVDDDAMSVDSFEDDGSWDPTEITPPDILMDLDPNPTTEASTNNHAPYIMDIDISSYRPGFWDFMNGDYNMVIDDGRDLYAQPSAGVFDQTPPSIMLSFPYTHGHPVHRALDVNEEVDNEGDFLMKPARSELR
ncbi:hypothetical protein PG990_000952 [Apiospora arundinis]|uniref:Uncharacterized protein n=1 Tax=Apiospora arundinis TaxID=335852 RepID=A0ABR2I0X4_9PEZI